jgi:hypothetical protein
MNREIKFRVWDGSQMHYPEIFTFDSECVCFAPKDLLGGSVRLPIANCMQYTGLKDKNDKEIYLFDFVKDRSGLIMLIVWREDLASFALRNDSWAYDHYFGEAVDAGNVEVIRNKFENPELL